MAEETTITPDTHRVYLHVKEDPFELLGIYTNPDDALNAIASHELLYGGVMEWDTLQQKSIRYFFYEANLTEDAQVEMSTHSGDVYYPPHVEWNGHLNIWEGWAMGWDEDMATNALLRALEAKRGEQNEF